MAENHAIPVLFGSETGIAASIAWQFARKAASAGIPTIVGSMDGFGTKRMRESPVIVFIVSTTGQGDPPGNMQASWGEMRKRSCEDISCKFTVLGLGDSSYDKYNYIGKMLFNRLRQLGGTPITEKGLADDQDVNGLDDGLLEWMGRTMSALSPYASITSEETRKLALTESRILVSTDQSATAAVTPSSRITYPVTVVKNERLTPEDHFQDVRHIEFKPISGQLSGLKPCCSVGFVPVVPQKEVNRMLSRLNLSGDETITISANTGIPLRPLDGEGLIGTTLSTRQLFSEKLDMSGVPTRGFFELLSRMKCSDEDREKLQELGSSDGAEELRFYCTRERRSYLEVLLDFSSVEISLGWVIECIPVAKCRQYSISSMPSSDIVSVTVAVVEYKTPYGRSKTGLCSTYLRSLQPLAQLQMSVHEPTISLPGVDSNTVADDVPPVVLVGPGTGVAPCISLIKHWHSNFPSSTSNKLILIRGCRNKGRDDFYHEYLDTLPEDWLTQRTAYSRDGPAKFYCQDLIRQDPVLLTRIPKILLEEDGFLYISGNSKDMPQSVTKAVMFCIMKHSSCTEEDAEEVIKELKKYNRIQYDTWA
eukprot:TRINITY_DN6102_c0_g1_i1.p1 TRINITY_DN6102_c0_g1~~TRINITY_DN6102_c0_g1_i1.p1  ORF type:complete len:592 (+),score=79.56 TRINITY_DN6102_c0_g1_i1:37-1812(+)